MLLFTFCKDRWRRLKGVWSGWKKERVKRKESGCGHKTLAAINFALV